MTSGDGGTSSEMTSRCIGMAASQCLDQLLKPSPPEWVGQGALALAPLAATQGLRTVQILDSATSPGPGALQFVRDNHATLTANDANVIAGGEVEAAESRKDFLHKLRICLKELRETKRWLRLVSRLKRLGEAENVTLCLNEVNELIRIFAASVRTTEKREMMPRLSALGVGRWALGVGR